MAKTIEKLSATSVKGKSPSFHHDGCGLYLQVKNGSRSWIFRYTLGGKARYMGLGPYPDVSLAEARRAAGTARTQLRRGLDPIEARREEARLAKAATVS